MPVDSGGADLYSVLCCLLTFLVALAIVLFVLRRRRPPGRGGPGGGGSGPTPPSGPPDPYAGMSTTDLSTRANGQLVAVDNAVRTSEQELGFATAQYGTDAVAPYTQAVAAAKDEVAAAFRIRQQLDDEIPEDEPTQRRLLAEILQRCAAVDQRLDAQADAFEQLRAMGDNAEQLSRDLTARAAQLRAGLPDAQATLARLGTRYTEGALAAVSGNATEAAARLDFADEQLGHAATGLAAADRGQAAVALRGAQQAVDQAGQLLGAVGKTSADLDAAGQAATRLGDELHAEVAAGRAALEAAGGSGSADQMNLAAAVARADQVATDVRTQLAAPRTDPLGMMRRLEGANTALGQALGAVRDAADRAGQARAQLEQALFAARSAVDSAAGFISTRRGAVGSTARARLAQAQQQLDAASAGGEPVAALSAAQRAHDLAAQAMDAARDDVERWSFPSGYGRMGGGPVIVSGGGMGGFGMGGIGGAVLGGILLENVLSGAGGGFGGVRIGLMPSEDDPVPPAPVQARFGGPSTWARHG
ncbi:hypothetical protein Cs7R123_32880 [Catellatospora sp. TT07R-123]|uniref:hypothetical protein n=1 Tax=Catellatospora sp. TT07R-123 TaxID=2733863 RepID=UPI001B10EC58|nr:hypothetical protein [Catellatospora sp. TT07R-123]GHJ45946.1 hypothetical protein Cs7R123_32880 [Catellatospora sp. TT07R-123]